MIKDGHVVYLFDIYSVPRKWEKITAVCHGLILWFAALIQSTINQGSQLTIISFLVLCYGPCCS